MGGSLEPEETPGGGLTMVVSLPASTDAIPGVARTPRTQPGQPVTRVLVVDDEPQLLRALSINLRARHYDVTPPPTATEALQLAAAHPPDVVILDLGLPDMDGTEVIAGLRGWTDVPILVLSGRSDSIDKVDALDAGADDYVTKPFGMDELLARLRAMTRRAPARQDAAARRRPSARPPSTWPRAASPRRGTTSASPRPSGTSSRSCSATRASCSASASCSTEVWGPGYETAQGNLRVYMAQLRRKLEPDPSRPRHLLNEPGMGYRFEP